MSYFGSIWGAKPSTSSPLPASTTPANSSPAIIPTEHTERKPPEPLTEAGFKKVEVTPDEDNNLFPFIKNLQNDNERLTSELSRATSQITNLQSVAIDVQNRNAKYAEIHKTLTQENQDKDKKIQDLQNQHAATLKALNEQHASEQTTSLQRIQRSSMGTRTATAAQEKTIDALKKDHAAAIDTLKTQQAKELELLRTQHKESITAKDTEIASLKENFEKELNALKEQNKLLSEQNKLLSEQQKQFDEFKKQIDALQKQVDAKPKVIAAAPTPDLSGEIAKLKADHTKQISALNAKLVLVEQTGTKATKTHEVMLKLLTKEQQEKIAKVEKGEMTLKDLEEAGLPATKEARKWTLGSLSPNIKVMAIGGIALFCIGGLWYYGFPQLPSGMGGA